MKHYAILYALVAVSLGAGLAAIYLHGESASGRIGYVDTARLLDGYEGMRQARQEYQAKAAVWQANVDTLTQEIKAKLMEYDRERAGLSAKERKLTEELLDSKRRQLAQYREAVAQKAQEEDQRMTQAVLEEVNGFLERYGEREGYRLILATGGGNLAYAEEGLDLTEAVLKELNAGRSGR